MESNEFAQEDKLLQRILTATQKNKKIIFLFGSGLTLPDTEKGELGVSSVNDVVEKIKTRFKKLNSSEILEKELADVLDSALSYQISMKALLDCAGQDELNEVIKEAVLNSFLNSNSVVSDSTFDASLLERQVDNWYLRNGVKSFGQIVGSFSEYFSPYVLTSNFDPLIEVSIRSTGSRAQTIVLSNDGQFTNVISPDSINVVHFHGFWHGSDTLHTSQQITRKRPQLKGCLRKVIENNLLVVIGYGGWNDVFTNTLIDIVSEGNTNYDLLWTFYEKDEKEIQVRYKEFLSKIDAAIGQRVILYKGIDCNLFFPKLNDALKERNKDVKPSKENANILSLNTVSTNKKAETIFLCDQPIVNNLWTGRKNELEVLNKVEFKALHISGIGGQGKSGLASQFLLLKISDSELYDYWDWRDCKEENNRIQSKIVSIIERFSFGKYRSFQLNDSSIEDLLDLMFEVLRQKRIVFIFDNVDSYIDLEKFVFTGPMQKLYNCIITKPHDCKFIFTGRPSVKYSDSCFNLIELKGLSFPDTESLFKQYKLNLKKDELSSLISSTFKLTNGHPLWISLIAGQATKGIDAVNQLIEGITVNETDDVTQVLANNTLNNLWNTLNDNQQTLLMFLAETIRPETKENLANMIESELSSNRFFRTLNTLSNLNLVVKRSTNNEKDQFELHPLVKQYIRSKYAVKERSKFITLLVNFYNYWIVILKPKLDHTAPFSTFENWTSKIELEINRFDFKAALASSTEIHHAINAAGYGEELLRIYHKLFIAIDWKKAIAEEYPYFHDELYNFIHQQIEFGKYDEAFNFLDKYSKSIPGKGINYISYCNLMSYIYWYQEDFSSAINWANTGLDLKKTSGIEATLDIEHQLALSLRDTKDNDNIDKALSIFLRGENIEHIKSSNEINESFGGTFYGNIGRCLQFKGEYTSALNCFKKSFILLSKESHSKIVINRGYACKWIAEIYKEEGLIKEMTYFIKLAVSLWEVSSPIRSAKLLVLLNTSLKDLEQNEASKILEMELASLVMECKKIINEDGFKLIG